MSTTTEMIAAIHPCDDLRPKFYFGHPLAPMPQAQRDALNVVTWSELT